MTLRVEEKVMTLRVEEKTMKFKIPTEIRAELWYDFNNNPCCSVGHIAHQLGYDYEEYNNSNGSYDTPFYFVKDKLGLTDSEIENLQHENDAALNSEQRKELFREFLTSRGHEVEE